MDRQGLTAFDLQALRRLAGPDSYARGRDYFAAGRVRSLGEKRGGAVVAKVRGSASYSVRLWADGDDLAYSCTCPGGDDGELCKHCVAVGLAVLAGTAKPRKTREPKPRVTLDDVREYLVREDKAVVVELLMERAQWDQALRDQLFPRTAKNRKKGGVDVEAMKEAIVQLRGREEPSTSDLNCQASADALDILRRESKLRQNSSKLAGVFFVYLIRRWCVGQVVA